MRFETKEYILKDGRRLTLKEPDKVYAREVLSVFRQIAEETHFTLNYPEEIDRKYTLEGEAAFLDGMKESPKSLMILAFVEDKYAGSCNIDFRTIMKTNHRATIGVGIIKEYWGLGIASILFENMIQAAKDRPGVTQLELDVLEDNTRAIALYKKYGFEIVATLPGAIKLKDGRKLAVHTMIKSI